MATSTTISLYLGSKDEGARNEQLISEYAARRGMNRSEWILNACLEQIKREEASNPGTKKDTVAA